MRASRVFVSVIGISAGVFAVVSFAYEATGLSEILGMVCAFCLGMLWGTDEEE